jgi:hypothetical protein
MKSNIIQFERKSAQNSQQPNISDALNSGLFLAEVSLHLLSKLTPSNQEDYESLVWITQKICKHEALISQFANQ